MDNKGCDVDLSKKKVKAEFCLSVQDIYYLSYVTWYNVKILAKRSKMVKHAKKVSIYDATLD